ncbi:putative bifunctional diguanylate cyclase/phosphodiesterase [Sphingomonas daechungensis]|uniref:putative bifunctional diguanylate cyclase/phosphodiesterase n=1 Tax=Sphingomonas daechungensis TaxID=1176646 RepID=UPI00378303AA
MVKGLFKFQRGSPLESSRHDWVVLGTVIAAVILLIGNGTDFFRRLADAQAVIGPGAQVAAIAMTLNVALILFGWRRYVDLQHETERRIEGERRAAIAATTDPVTGLLNRKGFADSVEDLRQRADADGAALLISSVQLHRFRAVYDRHGFDTGDAMLRGIAVTILEHAGEGAVVGRMGGDEFAIARTLEHDEHPVAEKQIETLLKLATRPFEIDGKMIQVGAFAGMAVAPAGEVRVPDLLRRADIALDHAKTGRTVRPIWFDAAMERALLQHGEIEQGIRFGLEHEQFLPFFEPQVDLCTGEITGFEVLARWRHPLAGIIPPDRFIPIAEEIGVMDRLSEQVIRAALVATRDWDPSIKISVNISPTQFSDGWLAERIVRILTETAFPADRLVVEITESSLFGDIDLARNIIASLKNQGIRLALDDFGTGFSSLSHLRQLPFDIIKIDRSFITNIHESGQSAAIVRAVATLADALEVPILVEGIESEAAHAAVLAIGCSSGQGWYFGKPMEADQAAQLISRKSQSAERSAQNSSRAA